MCVCVCVCVHMRVGYIYLKNRWKYKYKHTHTHTHTHTQPSYTSSTKNQGQRKNKIWLPSDILLLLSHLPPRSRDLTVELRWSAAASALAPSAPMRLAAETVRKERRRQYSQTSSSERLHLQRPLYTDHTHTHT